VGTITPSPVVHGGHAPPTAGTTPSMPGACATAGDIIGTGVAAVIGAGPGVTVMGGTPLT
jgi:hypothetical protein